MDEPFGAVNFIRSYGQMTDSLISAITGASQHLTRVKVRFGTGIFAKTIVLFSREAGIAGVILSRYYNVKYSAHDSS